MGTTVWIDDGTREELRRLQESMGTGSVNATIRRLMERPAPDAHTIFARHRPSIRATMRRHGIKRLVAFGSRARGDAREASDFDLAVELRRDAKPLAILAAEAELEKELGVPVHIVALPDKRLEKVIRDEGVPFAG